MVDCPTLLLKCTYLPKLDGSSSKSPISFGPATSSSTLVTIWPCPMYCSLFTTSTEISYTLSDSNQLPRCLWRSCYQLFHLLLAMDICRELPTRSTFLRTDLLPFLELLSFLWEWRSIFTLTTFFSLPKKNWLKKVYICQFRVEQVCQNWPIFV